MYIDRNLPPFTSNQARSALLCHNPCMYTVCTRAMSYHVHTGYIHVIPCPYSAYTCHTMFIQCIYKFLLFQASMVLYVHCLYHVIPCTYSVYTLSSLSVPFYRTGSCNLLHRGFIQGIVHSLTCLNRLYAIITCVYCVL